MTSWRETRLWKAIDCRGGESVELAKLQLVLDKAEKVLSHSHTSPLTFTLHDSDHSFRVSEMMADIVSDRLEKLSVIELSSLLLSAYLHDIGMTPSFSISQPSRNYLLTGDIKLAKSMQEAADIQAWLDSSYSGMQPPINSDDPVKTAELVDEIHAYYCRHMHNEWSGMWIDENLEDIFYNGYSKDVSFLCKSHHFDIGELRDVRFNVRKVGAPAQNLNLRFLACVLRVADVLEFDPERTPQVILNQRGVKKSSAIYWHKDHYLSFVFDQSKRVISLSARTPDAVTHRAILDTISQVEKELSTCAVLSSESLLSSGIVSDEERLNYVWTLPSSVVVDVREADDSFSYINGAFRPSSRKILSLLSGTELYGTTFAAVRELLQNAFDAVWEQIALEWRLADDPEAYDDILAVRRRVGLSVEVEGDEVWLSCVDTGAGMTKRIIEDYLLVGGAEIRPEVRVLERHCAAKGLYFGRTGQFGIGMLSYFMIADRLELETRRSSAGIDEDATGWRFEVEGLDSFGELRRSARLNHGTSVRLRLRGVTVDRAVEWSVQLQRYLRATLARTPCRFTFKDPNGEHLIDKPDGWLLSPEEILASIVEGVRDENHVSDPLTKAERARAEQLKELWVQFRQSLTSNAAILLTENRNVNGGSAEVQINLIGSEVGGHALCALAVTNGEEVLPFPDGRLVHQVEVGDELSWRGFGVKLPSRNLRQFRSLACRIDIRKDARVSVSRDKLSAGLAPDTYMAINQFRNEVRSSFVRHGSASPLRCINEVLLRKFHDTPIDRSKALWIFQGDDGRYRVSDLSSSFISVFTARYGSYAPHVARISSEEVRVAASIKLARAEVAEMTAHYSGGSIVILSGKYAPQPAVLWREGDELQNTPTSTANFDGPLNSIFCIVTSGGPPVVNADHSPMLKNYSDTRLSLNSDDILRALESEGAAFSYVLDNVERSSREWTALLESSPDSFSRLISLCGFSDDRPLRIWRWMGAYDDDVLIEIKPDFISTTHHFLTAHGLKFSDGVVPLIKIDLWDAEG